MPTRTRSKGENFRLLWWSALTNMAMTTWTALLVGGTPQPWTGGLFKKDMKQRYDRLCLARTGRRPCRRTRGLGEQERPYDPTQDNTAFAWEGVQFPNMIFLQQGRPRPLALMGRSVTASSSSSLESKYVCFDSFHPNSKYPNVHTLVAEGIRQTFAEIQHGRNVFTVPFQAKDPEHLFLACAGLKAQGYPAWESVPFEVLKFSRLVPAHIARHVNSCPFFSAVSKTTLPGFERSVKRRFSVRLHESVAFAHHFNAEGLCGGDCPNLPVVGRQLPPQASAACVCSEAANNGIRKERERLKHGAVLERFPSNEGEAVCSCTARASRICATAS